MLTRPVLYTLGKQHPTLHPTLCLTPSTFWYVPIKPKSSLTSIWDNLLFIKPPQPARFKGRLGCVIKIGAYFSSPCSAKVIFLFPVFLFIQHKNILSCSLPSLLKTELSLAGGSLRTWIGFVWKYSNRELPGEPSGRQKKQFSLQRTSIIQSCPVFSPICRDFRSICDTRSSRRSQTWDQTILKRKSKVEWVSIKRKSKGTRGADSAGGGLMERCVLLDERTEEEDGG